MRPMANSYENLTKSSLYEMSRKSKLYFCLGIALVGFLFYATFSGNTDQFDAMKQTLDEHEMLIRDTREQILDRLKMCQRDCQHWDPDMPIIYIITPTYTRPVQKAELTRFSQTLMLVSNVHWILIEDSPKKTLLVENFLARSPLNYTHLCEPTPPFYKRKGAARGVVQRNAALKWLRRNKSLNDKGVIYFADDDNTYAIQVFREMRFTKEVSVWPVGLAGGLMVERPIVNMTTGKVTGFNSAWRPDRMFPIDMAGFAINLRHFLKRPNAAFTYNVTAGFQETYMLQQLTTKDRLEPRAENCTQVLVWHTRTENARLSEESKLRVVGAHSDGGIEV